MRITNAILAASLGLVSAGAVAQEPVAGEQIVLRVEQGQVMTSQGGEFVPAQTGTVLQAGDRIMVTEGGAATVFFDDACFAGFSEPGVHVVARRCDAAAGDASARDLRTPAIVAGAVAVAAVALSSGGSDNDEPEPPPVSR